MQITETISEPLHREFTVVVGATDLDAKLTGKLGRDEISGLCQLFAAGDDLPGTTEDVF